MKEITEITKETFSLMEGLAENPWGMYAAQKCSAHVRVIEDAGWYNKCLKYVGFGDLSAKNVVDLAETLPEKELFIALTDKDSFRNFIRETPEHFATFCGGGFPVVPSHDEPGIDYIKDRAVLMVARGSIFMKKKDGYPYNHPVGEEIFQRMHERNFPLDRNAVKTLHPAKFVEMLQLASAR